MAFLQTYSLSVATVALTAKALTHSPGVAVNKRPAARAERSLDVSVHGSCSDPWLPETTS